MNNNCNLCGSASIKKSLSTSSGDVFKCQYCGLVFLIPKTDPNEMYTEEYFVSRKNYFFCDGLVDASGRDKAHIKDFRDGLDWIETYQKPPGKLLDIGCAMGSFLSIAQERGWECYGAELSDYAASKAGDRLGIEIFNGIFRDAEYPDNFFDVITMWDVIEHFADPVSELNEAKRVLKPNGLLLVNTPNEKALIRFLARFVYKGSSGIIRYPIDRLYHEYHIYYFDSKALSHLFEKSGFKIITAKKKIMPISRGRSSAAVKAIRQLLTIAERLLHAEYELFTVARK